MSTPQAGDAARARNGFTLIELLIVVLIIAILAAIAVPNFLESQTRAKIARAMADMRSAAVAIEAYQVDNNAYPIYRNFLDQFTHLSAHQGEVTFLPYTLTSPISYISTVFLDPFPLRYGELPNDRAQEYVLPNTYHFRRRFDRDHPEWDGIGVTYGPEYIRLSDRVRNAYDNYNHTGWYLDKDARNESIEWQLASPGPDMYMPSQSRAFAPQYYSVHNPVSNYVELRYDPTNGTSSAGDIMRFGP